MKLMTKLAAVIVSALLFFSSFPAYGFAAGNIVEVPDAKVVINEKNVTFSDVIISSEGSILLPLRSLLTSLGVQDDARHIIWNAAEKSVTFIKDSTEVKLVQGNHTAYIDDIPATLDVPPVGYSKNGRTYIPVRFVAQSLGKIVEWNSSSKSVIITDPKVVTVGTAEELVAALDSNTKIILKKGVYNLSEVKQEYSEKKAFWEGVFDGNQLVLKGVDNLTLECEGSDIAELAVEPRYANVLSFRGCSNITIRNIKAGHTPEQGECAGGVLAFDDSRNISIVNAELYGCGIEGLTLNNTNSLSFAISSIHDCNSAIMDLNNSKDVSCFKSKFYDNRGFSSGVTAIDNSSLAFDGCDFSNNTIGAGFDGGSFFNINLSKVIVNNSRLTGDSYSSLASNPSGLTLVNTVTEQDAAPLDQAS